MWYVYHPNLFEAFPLGQQLGELEDEKPEEIIVSAVGTGSKSYALKTIPCDTPPEEYPQALAATKDAFIAAIHHKTGLVGCITKEIKSWPMLVAGVFSYLTGTTTCVKVKGITLGAENSKRVNFDSMKELYLRHVQGEASTIDNIVGPPIKRHKVGPGTVVLRSTKPLEGAKTMRFTADKRLPPPPEVAHHYWPGFMLPKGHQGLPAKEMALRTPSVLGRPLPPAVRDACLQLHKEMDGVPTQMAKP